MSHKLPLIEELDSLSSFSALFGSSFTDRETVNSGIDLCFYSENSTMTQKMVNCYNRSKKYVSQVVLNGYMSRTPVMAGFGNLHICIFDDAKKFKQFTAYDDKRLIKSDKSSISATAVPLQFQLRSTAALSNRFQQKPYTADKPPIILIKKIT